MALRIAPGCYGKGILLIRSGLDYLAAGALDLIITVLKSRGYRGLDVIHQIVAVLLVEEHDAPDGLLVLDDLNLNLAKVPQRYCKFPLFHAHGNFLGIKGLNDIVHILAAGGDGSLRALELCPVVHERLTLGPEVHLLLGSVLGGRIQIAKLH